MRASLRVSLTAVFASLHVVLYFFSFGLWRNWAIYIAPIEAVILGPRIGFVAALIGSSVARTLRPDPIFWMFGIVAEPLSVLLAGLLTKGRWKVVLVSYLVMLSAYFVHPFGTALPLWTILDILLAIFLIYPASKLSHHLLRKDVRWLSAALILVSFVCVATDSLLRVFLLVPCGLYGLFFENFEILYAVFVGAAVDSFFEDVIVVIVSLVAGSPLLLSLLKLKLIDNN